MILLRTDYAWMREAAIRYSLLIPGSRSQALILTCLLLIPISIMASSVTPNSPGQASEPVCLPMVLQPPPPPHAINQMIRRPARQTENRLHTARMISSLKRKTTLNRKGGIYIQVCRRFSADRGWKVSVAAARPGCPCSSEVPLQGNRRHYKREHQLGARMPRMVEGRKNRPDGGIDNPTG